MTRPRISQEKIKEVFKLHAQRAEALRLLITAMIQRGTVNIKQCATVAQSHALTESIERRFTRLLNDVELCPKTLALFIAEIIGLKNKNEKYVLIFDRTYWQHGKTHINLLYLAVVYQNVAIPLFFKLLGEDTENGKKGNSSIIERQILLDQYIDTFGKDSVECLLGDREFMGCDWINLLHEYALPYVMRVKDRGLKIQNRFGNMTMLNEYCQSFPFDEVQDLGLKTLGSAKPFQTHVALLKLTPDHLVEETKLKQSRGSKNGRNKANIRHKKEAKRDNVECVLEPETIVLCYSKGLENVYEKYRLRWHIEMLFRSLKTAGFNIEDSSINDPKRIIFLMQAAMLGLATAFTVGMLSNEIRKIPIKKHGYRAQTFIKRGMHDIHIFLQRYAGKMKKYIHVKYVLKIVKPWKRKIKKTFGNEGMSNSICFKQEIMYVASFI